MLIVIVGAAYLAIPTVASASADDAGDADYPDDADDGDDADYETVVHGERQLTPILSGHRAKAVVTREDMERRMPRSAPDALHYEPGVFVQQTAHGQGSAFIRGLTGQQTLILFDGIRLNNSTFRQGPNQYLFTLDTQTIESLQILRGGASTEFGSDALGGVILASPIEPRSVPVEHGGLAYGPQVRFKGGTVDGEAGGRAQLEIVSPDLGFLGGIGGRHAGLLDAAGAVLGPLGDEPSRVPRFAGNGRTQLGTGFDELTADGRLIYQVAPDHVLKLAAYAYRQFDAPRTDQCPAAYAPFDECLTYEEQFRSLVYGVWRGDPGYTLLKRFRATLSWQQQHERRSLRRPGAYVENTGRDTVDTLGATWQARSRRFEPSSWLDVTLDFGVDTYVDRLRSAAWIGFADIGVTQRLSRGQYLDDSTYVYGGAFVDGTARLYSRVRLRAGARFSWIAAQAPADVDSGSVAIDRAWYPWVGNVGLEWRMNSWLYLLANADLSFRAPNLDDLTSRQQTGPGFQFENPSLTPERAATLELGGRIVGPVRVELWAFRTQLADGVVKSPRPDSACPPATPRCQASWTRFQLVNAASASEILGIEASIFALLPGGFEGRANSSWTRGEGPNVGDGLADNAMAYEERVPLSRIPPLNGSAELLWRHPSGVSASAGFRWALLQDRLALADVSDERIPQGGTPGFAVLDLRVAYRISNLLLLSIALENVTDAVYRYHGSSVNGPGRGLVAILDLGPLWRL
ncbi:MAG: hypothetical protein A2289_21680 [Deltaproteobacteria bacterium RIFOXYA12_FULL_58_15]|nr:MAG: hypothetical protein A2289_21680 [Deltaproteobacteria bacterium RIFOXYA12_FULL_58_15]